GSQAREEPSRAGHVAPVSIPEFPQQDVLFGASPPPYRQDQARKPDQDEPTRRDQPESEQQRKREAVHWMADPRVWPLRGQGAILRDPEDRAVGLAEVPERPDLAEHARRQDDHACPAHRDRDLGPSPGDQIRVDDVGEYAAERDPSRDSHRNGGRE